MTLRFRCNANTFHLTLCRDNLINRSLQHTGTIDLLLFELLEWKGVYYRLIYCFDQESLRTSLATTAKPRP